MTTHEYRVMALTRFIVPPGNRETVLRPVMLDYDQDRPGREKRQVGADRQGKIQPVGQTPARTRWCLRQLQDTIRSSKTQKGIMAITNTLRLYPYFLRDTWVFDDERTGLKEEAFVRGMTEMISRLVALKEMVAASKGFLLEFADQPFAEYDASLSWRHADPSGGDWYTATIGGESMEGWLCPALTLYFKSAPKLIFVRVDRLPPGIDPIWTPPAGVRTRQFVEAPKRP